MMTHPNTTVSAIMGVEKFQKRKGKGKNGLMGPHYTITVVVGRQVPPLISVIGWDIIKLKM